MAVPLSTYDKWRLAHACRDGLTAKQIRTVSGTNVPTGSLIAGSPYFVIYDNGVGEFILVNAFTGDNDRGWGDHLQRQLPMRYVTYAEDSECSQHHDCWEIRR